MPAKEKIISQILEFSTYGYLRTMKRAFYSVVAFLITMTAMAQEEPAKEVQRSGSSMQDLISTDVKMWMLLSFTAIVVWLVMRTFRNKPEM